MHTQQNEFTRFRGVGETLNRFSLTQPPSFLPFSTKEELDQRAQALDNQYAVHRTHPARHPCGVARGRGGTTARLQTGGLWVFPFARLRTVAAEDSYAKEHGTYEFGKNDLLLRSYGHQTACVGKRGARHSCVDGIIPIVSVLQGCVCCEGLEESRCFTLRRRTAADKPCSRLLPALPPTQYIQPMQH